MSADASANATLARLVEAASVIRFSVPGKAEPKGSTRSFVRNGKAVTTSDNPELKRWQRAVGNIAADVMAGRFALTEAVAVSLYFALERPTSHLRTNGELTKAANVYPIGRPDVDKLARGVLDALTGIVWADDAQVVRLTATKRYVRAPYGGVAVTVDEIEPVAFDAVGA